MNKISVCGIRTCNGFENGSTDKEFIAKMNFALAREIIHDQMIMNFHLKQYF